MSLGIDPERVRAPLERFLAQALRQDACRIARMTRLAGGTVKDNWLVEVQAGEAGAPAHGGEAIRLVLRTARVVGTEDSLPAEHEYAVLCAAARAGVRVPQPL